jgi:hypothetical protein
MAKSAQPPRGAASPSPRMREAWKHFEGGDKLAARREAEGVLRDNPSEVDAREARELLERTRTPPVAFLLAGVAAALIVGLVALALFRM